MMLHLTANLVYELPMGSDDFVDRAKNGKGRVDLGCRAGVGREASCWE